MGRPQRLTPLRLEPRAADRRNKRDQGLPEPGSRLPTSPSGRTPQWVVDEARGLPVQQPGGAATASGVVLHELARLVGLDRVDDDAQLLHPRTVRGVTDYAAGDLPDLAGLGQGPCVPEL